MGDLKTVRFSVSATPRTRFATDFAAGALHQSLASFIEQAVLRLADGVVVAGRNWEDYWDDSEAVRRLRVLIDPKYPHLEEDMPLRELILAHRDFFFDGADVARFRAEVLWPKIAHYAELFRVSKHVHPLQTGEKMGAALKAAGIKWSPK